MKQDPDYPSRFIGIANVHDIGPGWFENDAIAIHTIELSISNANATFTQLTYDWLSDLSTELPYSQYFGYAIEAAPQGGYMIAGCLNNCETGSPESNVDLLFTLDTTEDWTPYTYRIPWTGPCTITDHPGGDLEPYYEEWYGAPDAYEGMSYQMASGQNHGEMEAVYLPSVDKFAIIGTYANASQYGYSVIACFFDNHYPPPDSDASLELDQGSGMNISASVVMGTGMLSVELPDGVGADVDPLVHLYDISGRLKGTVSLNAASITGNRFEIELSGLDFLGSSGVYLMQIQIGNKTGSCSFVLMR